MSENSTPDSDWLKGYIEVEELSRGRASRKSALGQLIRTLLGHPVPLFGGIALTLLGSGVVLIEPRALATLIDDGLVPKDWTSARYWVFVILLLQMVRVGSFIIQDYLFAVLGQRVMQDLRMAMYRHLHRLPLSLYDRTPAGKLVTRITNDVSTLAELFTAGFVTIVGSVATVVGMSIGILLLDWKLGLMVLAVLPPLLGVSIYFTGRLTEAYRDARSKLSALNAFLAENFMGIKVVQLFNRERLQLQRFARLNQWYADAQTSSVRVFAIIQPSITWATGLAMALMIWKGGGAVMGGELKVGVLAAIFAYVLQLFQPLRDIADKWNTFLSGMAAAERIYSLLSWRPEEGMGRLDLPSERLPSVRGRIEFKNVWFSYDSEKPSWVLKDVSFTIEPGMKVGLVGATGSGKTTIVSLLMRLYEIQKGEILLDGMNIRALDKRALRASMGMIQQDVFLFSGTVRENLTFWGSSKGSIPLEVPNLDSPLQERGSNLSAGEKQVLAFARAGCSEPSIWILDEATANVDSDTEVRLDQALRQSSDGRTLLVIAHRLATIRDADLILVLSHGVLVEQGRHGELIKKNGLYARLQQFQRRFDTVALLTPDKK